MLQVSLDRAIQLGEQYLQGQNWVAARAVFQRIAAAHPTNAAAWRGLGLVEHWSGGSDAIAYMRRAVELQPDWTEALNNLCALLLGARRFHEAIKAMRHYLAQRPNDVEVLVNLGSALGISGRVLESIDIYRQAISFDPNHAVALNNLGTALGQLGRTDEGIAMLRRAVTVRPDYQIAWTNLGGGLATAGQTDDALEAYRRALLLKADDVWALSGTGTALRDLGKASEALDYYRQSLRLEANPAVHSNLVMCLFYIEQATAGDVLAEAIRFARQHAEPLTAAADRRNRPAHPATRIAGAAIVQDVGGDGETGEEGEGPAVIDRPLRVGYISPEFISHPVGWFMLPLLEHHDRAAVEAIGYCGAALEDGQTRRLKAQTAKWRNIVGLDDASAAKLIHQDGIDILVDLCGHTGSNRLLVMARRPAPVQVTYLWHAGTTGLSAIDWRLSDPWIDPDGVAAAYSERTIRLSSYWCYRPPIETGELGPPPSEIGEPITFGCLNEPGKMSDGTLAAWTRILAAVPGSRLMVHAPAGSTRPRIEAAMDRHGLGHERLICVGKMSLADYFACHRRIDIVLDSFPWAGGTTSCDAIWMGVPIVTLAGRTAVGRGGVSILNLIGHGELVASDIDEYVSIATSLANNPRRLADLHKSLRGEMASSPLMDERKHAREIERAYRWMWQMWKSQGV